MSFCLLFIAATLAATPAQEKLLDLPVENITEGKQLPPSGDLRDYRSLAIYWWPNQLTGVPYYRRDGIRNPEADDYDAPKLRRMTRSVERLVDAWQKTDDPRFARNAVERLRVWFLDPETRMNPNFNYAQFIPGIRQGSYHGIVESNGLAEHLLPALQTLHAGGQFTAGEWAGLQGWFREFLEWLETSPNGRVEDSQDSNQSLWYDYQRVSFARFIDEQERAEAILREVGPRRISRQIAPDGRMEAEMKRTRSYGYVCYALRPLLQMAEIGRELDIDLLAMKSPEGGSIKMAMLFAARHAASPETWPGRQIEPIRPALLAGLIDRYLAMTPDPELEQAKEALLATVPDATDP